MNKTLVLLLTFIILLVFMVPGCVGQGDDGKGPIVVGSKIDTEGSLLSQIIILMLKYS